MVLWVKIAVVALCAAAIGGAIAVFGLPQGLGGRKPAEVTAQAPKPDAPAAQPAPASPEKPADKQAEVATAEPQAPAAPSAAAPSPTAPNALQPPSFDVVRVEPTGEAVIAGRADPGVQVTLLRNGAAHDKAATDEVGQFAMVPPPFKPGTYDLQLDALAPDGRREKSKQTVTVSVPASGKDVIVALASPDKPTEVLSQGASGALEPIQKPVQLKPGERIPVTLVTVEAEDSGKFFATGAAMPGSAVRLYLNETFLATATANKQGRWSFTISRGLAPGNYRVRVDEVDTKGTVISRAEVPFDFAPRVASAAPGAPSAAAPSAPAAPAPGSPSSGEATADVGSSAADVVVPAINTTTVVRGDSLWRISKRVYGRGLRYTVIYQANQQQIRDPHRIYPGQLFVLPHEEQARTGVN